MTILRESLLFLLSCGKNIFVLEGRYKVMNHFLKGIIVMVGIIIVNMIINIICNINGIDLNATGMSTVSSICAIFIYDRWIRNEK